MRFNCTHASVHMVVHPTNHPTRCAFGLVPDQSRDPYAVRNIRTPRARAPVVDQTIYCLCTSSVSRCMVSHLRIKVPRAAGALISSTSAFIQCIQRLYCVVCDCILVYFGFSLCSPARCSLWHHSGSVRRPFWCCFLSPWCKVHRNWSRSTWVNLPHLLFLLTNFH